MMAFASVLQDSHKACPTFVNQGGICVFRRILENRSNYSEDGILTLMTCIGLITAHWNLRNHCIESGIIPALLNAAQNSKSPQFMTTCANALYGLLCNEGGRKQFLENDGFSFLVELLSHIEFPVVVSAVPMIHILGTYQDITRGLIEQGILQVIWQRQDLISKNGPLRTAFEHLISTYLPVKYAISGHIDPYEKLKDGFYDIGGLKSTDCFMTMNQMTWENRDIQRQVLFLNWNGSFNDEAALKENKSLRIMKAENQNCQSLVDVVKQDLGKIRSEKELVRSIAVAVSDRMGGILDKWRASAHTEDVEVADLQLKHKSVVIPISMINNGGFRTRALLFKAMCDVFGIPCSVERGEYSRMWNVVLLQSKRPQKPSCPCAEDEETARSLVYTEKLRRFVVDLVYQPGTLLPVNSYDANSYCFV
ncbi:uncharacterized protein LOC118434799 [Folsomia candida]|uniref:uncharacterized protein LOC118434799 n=1 Tax=Folsomia candida TaxID=158441 RepID=UPI001604E810|nr:uncharacterized protein LOC118434799 [Folsomia candida]